MNIKYLEELREQSGISCNKMSKLLGKGLDYYNNRKRGLVRFNVDDLSSFIHIFNLNDEQVKKLINGKDKGDNVGNR